MEHQWPVFISSQLNVLQKFMWTTLLAWRVIYDILGHFLFPIVFAFWLTRGQVALPMNGFIWFALFFTFFSGPFEALIAYKNATLPKASIIQYFCYAFLAFPYTMFKNTIQVVAIRDELVGVREWVISQRDK
ncbi:MAG: hypothetical protein HQL21_00205 [Candidatus Omnitrophica bacterium]|nr:hypothetical protein [Candidatus Omnitrophota bacterium]